MDFWLYFWTALGIGALHALEPGHGKSIMGAYLVLSRGRSIDAILLGLTSAITHTLVILVMAYLAHTATAMATANAAMPQDEVETWLKLVSGAIIILVGLRMLLRRTNTCGCGCGHDSHLPLGGKLSSGGAFSKAKFAALKGRRGNLLDVLLLGFTNGLMPCPSALAVLLLSLSSGALVSGLILVLAFGVGGAIALVAIGLFFVHISSLAGGLFSNKSWGYLSKASGALICAIGCVTVWSAFIRL